MLSRVADSIFWMARYMERTNGMLRLLRTNYISSQDEVKDFTWQAILRIYSDATEEEITAIGNHSPHVMQHLLLDKLNGSSVINNITRARENARAAQDHLTKEVWQCLNDYTPNTQVSLLPPPCEELTTKEPSFNATLVNPPGTISMPAGPTKA